MARQDSTSLRLYRDIPEASWPERLRFGGRHRRIAASVANRRRKIETALGLPYNRRMANPGVKQANGPKRPPTFSLCNCDKCVARWRELATILRQMKTAA
jgi:hypothetical protein